MGEEHLPQRVMSGELVGGKGYSGGQAKDWMANVKEDVFAFRMGFEGAERPLRRLLADVSDG